MEAEYGVVRQLALDLIEQGDLAVTGARGSKSANKKMRRISNDLSKALPVLRKASIASEGGGEAE